MAATRPPGPRARPAIPSNSPGPSPSRPKLTKSTSQTSSKRKTIRQLPKIEMFQNDFRLPYCGVVPYTKYARANRSRHRGHMSRGSGDDPPRRPQYQTEGPARSVNTVPPRRRPQCQLHYTFRKLGLTFDRPSIPHSPHPPLAYHQHCNLRFPARRGGVPWPRRQHRKETWPILLW